MITILKGCGIESVVGDGLSKPDDGPEMGPVEEANSVTLCGYLAKK